MLGKKVHGIFIFKYIIYALFQIMHYKCIISSSNIILTNSIFKKYAKQKECLCILPRLLTNILLLIFKHTSLPKSTYLLIFFPLSCVLKRNVF